MLFVCVRRDIMSVVCSLSYSGVFFFSSRRRHTRCALVTGVQTCALPIYEGSNMAKLRLATIEDIKPVKLTIELPASVHRDLLAYGAVLARERSEERRVGKECVSTCRSRWSQYH